MRVIPKDKVIFSFNAEHPCQYTVQDGETFWVETDDCYSGQITDASVKRPDIDISIMDCSVGPIAVQGARPGDSIPVPLSSPSPIQAWRSPTARPAPGTATGR